MKNLFVLLIILMSVLACSKDNNRRSGVCYCEFSSGDQSEYDLSNMSRAEQIDACNTHDTNAANFGGRCELE